MAVDEVEDVRCLTAFWNAALNDHELTFQALRVLRGWVLNVARAPDSEAALATLLPTLAAAPANHQRITHLLRTVRDYDESVPAAAVRLRATVHPA
ncbi:hypothetical protein [Streptomyces adelaidensis]|uniref:hypothetical protein n=1 Tax=Streptomyces adelaidensis TaxID=2796465 RepID=UPI001F296EED|nr:hypothetical protein [Streptomyces adelaidensis]